MSRAAGSGLFLRMASYVAAALLLFALLAVGSLVLVASQELESYTATRHGTLGREAARVLERGGPAALARWLREEARVPDDITVYVLDGDGADLLGREVPELYRDFVRRRVVGATREDVGSYRPVRLAPLLVAPDGRRFAFLVLPNRIGVLGSPATWLGVGLAALVAIALVAAAIARAFARPIGELQRTARELAAGHTQARVPQAIVSRGDELGALAADFNAMAERIAALLETRQRLMSEISHELRSPLARLRATAELASLRGTLAAEDARRIEHEVRRMDALLGDLLRHAQLEAAQPAERRLLRIEELLAQLVDDEQPEALRHGCRLVLAGLPALPVVGDAALLRSAFENVLRNAIRHSPQGEAVEIGAGLHEAQVTVSIADRGPGVAADDLERIFEPFQRARAPHGRAGSEGAPRDAASRAPADAAEPTGSGLGLAIARRALEAHRGSISAQCRDGGGLCVTMRLPAARFS